MVNASVTGKSPMVLIGVLLIGALSFAVALSWNDMAKAFVQKYVKESNTFTASLYYAGIMTAALIIVGFVIVKFFPTVYDEIK